MARPDPLFFLFLDLFGVDDLLPAALEAADHGVAGDDLAATLP